MQRKELLLGVFAALCTASSALVLFSPDMVTAGDSAVEIPNPRINIGRCQIEVKPASYSAGQELRLEIYTRSEDEQPHEAQLALSIRAEDVASVMSRAVAPARVVWNHVANIRCGGRPASSSLIVEKALPLRGSFFLILADGDKKSAGAVTSARQQVYSRRYPLEAKSVGVDAIPVRWRNPDRENPNYPEVNYPDRQQPSQSPMLSQRTARAAQLSYLADRTWDRVMSKH